MAVAWLASPPRLGDRGGGMFEGVDEDRGQPLVEAFVGQVGDQPSI